MDEHIWNKLATLVEEYIGSVRLEFEAHRAVSSTHLDLGVREEVITGLIARQCSLAIEIAKAPSIWNGHACPVLLRCMGEVFLTLVSRYESAVRFLPYLIERRNGSTSFANSAS